MQQMGVELAARRTVRALHCLDHLVIVAEGDMPSAGFEADISPSPKESGSHVFSLLRVPAFGPFPDEATPYRYSEVFRVGERPATVSVRHAEGVDEVQVEDGGALLPDFARALGEGAGAADGVVAVGFSRALSFDDAFADALAKLPPTEDDTADTVHFIRVLESGALFGGVADFSDLWVRICRTTRQP